MTNFINWVVAPLVIGCFTLGSIICSWYTLDIIIDSIKKFRLTYPNFFDSMLIILLCYILGVVIKYLYTFNTHSL